MQMFESMITPTSVNRNIKDNTLETTKIESRTRLNVWRLSLNRSKKTTDSLNRSKSAQVSPFNTPNLARANTFNNIIYSSVENQKIIKSNNKVPQSFFNHKNNLKTLNIEKLKKNANKKPNPNTAPWENSTFKYNPIHCDSSEFCRNNNKGFNFQTNESINFQFSKPCFEKNRPNTKVNKHKNFRVYKSPLYFRNSSRKKNFHEFNPYKNNFRLYSKYPILNKRSKSRRALKRKRARYHKRKKYKKQKIKKMSNSGTNQDSEIRKKHESKQETNANFARSRSLDNFKKINGNNLKLRRSQSLINLSNFIQDSNEYFKKPVKRLSKKKPKKAKKTNKKKRTLKRKKSKSHSNIFRCLINRCSCSKPKKNPQDYYDYSAIYSAHDKVEQSVSELKEVKLVSMMPKNDQNLTYQPFPVRQPSLKLFKKRHRITENLFNTNISDITTGNNPPLSPGYNTNINNNSNNNNEFTTVTSIAGIKSPMPKQKNDIIKYDPNPNPNTIIPFDTISSFNISRNLAKCEEINEIDDLNSLENKTNSKQEQYNSDNSIITQLNYKQKQTDLSSLGPLDNCISNVSEYNYSNNLALENYDNEDIKSYEERSSELKSRDEPTKPTGTICNDNRLLLKSNQTRTKPKTKLKDTSKHQQLVNSKSKTLAVAVSKINEFSLISSHLNEIKNLFINWNYRPDNSKDLKHDLHDWALWRTKLNDILIKTCFTPIKLQKSIFYQNENKPKNEPTFVNYSEVYGKDSSLEPENFMFFGIPRARLSIRSSRTSNFEIFNDSKSEENFNEGFQDLTSQKNSNNSNSQFTIRQESNQRDDSIFEKEKLIRSSSEGPIITGINVREKIKVFENTSSKSNMNQDSYLRLKRNSSILRRSTRDESNMNKENAADSNRSPNLHSGFTNAAILSSSLNISQSSSQLISVPLPGHFCPENKRDRSNDADLKRDINVNSLIINGNHTFEDEFNDGTRSTKFIQTNHFYSQDPERMFLMSMPNEQINQAISDDKNTKKNSKPSVDVLKAADGDIIFHKPDKQNNIIADCKLSPNVSGVNKTVISNNINKHQENHMRRHFTTNLSNHQPNVSPTSMFATKIKEKIIKNEKYNYLSPLKNMLKSKNKTKDNQMRAAAQAAIDAALTPTELKIQQAKEKDKEKEHHQTMLRLKRKQKEKLLNEINKEPVNRENKKDTTKTKKINKETPKTEKNRSIQTTTGKQTLGISSSRSKTRVKVRRRSRQKSKSRAGSVKVRHKSLNRKSTQKHHHRHNQTNENENAYIKQQNPLFISNTVQNIEYFSNPMLDSSSVEQFNQIDKDIIDLTSSSSSILSMKSSSSLDTSNDELNPINELGLIPRVKNRKHQDQKKTKKNSDIKVKKDHKNIQEIKNKSFNENILEASQNRSIEVDLRKKIMIDAFEKTKTHKPPDKPIPAPHLTFRKDKTPPPPPNPPPPPPIDHDQKRPKEKRENSSLISHNQTNTSFTSKITIPMVHPPAPPALPPPSLPRYNFKHEVISSERSFSSTFTTNAANNEFYETRKQDKSIHNYDTKMIRATKPRPERPEGSTRKENEKHRLDKVITYNANNNIEKNIIKNDHFEVHEKNDLDKIANFKKEKSQKSKNSSNEFYRHPKTSEVFFSVSQESDCNKKKTYRKVKVESKVIEKIKTKAEYEQEDVLTDYESSQFHEEIMLGEFYESDRKINSYTTSPYPISSSKLTSSYSYKLPQPSNSPNNVKSNAEDKSNIFKLPPKNKTTQNHNNNSHILNNQNLNDSNDMRINSNMTTPAQFNNRSNNQDSSISFNTSFSNHRTKPKTSKEILQEIARLTNGTTPSYKYSPMNPEPNHPLNSTELDATFSSNSKIILNKDSNSNTRRHRNF